MRICIILEGCYPYVHGGVSSWIHNYMKALPEYEFVIWTVAEHSGMKGKYKYELPENVVEIHETFLGDALKLVGDRKKLKFTAEEVNAIEALINSKDPDWDLLFEMYQHKKINPISFLQSEEFLIILKKICMESYPYIAFADLFHTIRSMLLPILYMLGQKVPDADIYHTICTGYAGILGSMGSYINKKPLILSEHGIYTREREEEILRAKWTPTEFKRHWISLFYMLSRLCYGRASRVTSLFWRAKEIQVELGCEREKCRVISNGVHCEKFETIPRKEEDGFTDIGAVVRIARIKDIKTMLYAFHELNLRIPETRLHILGDVNDEEYMEECKQLILDLDIKNVIFAGVVDVIKYMEKLDFTILTSISEGQPLSIIESFAAGRPCVATDVGSCRELIEGSGEDMLGRAGFCVPPLNKAEIANAMEFLCKWKEERLTMGETGKKRALKYFRHQDMMDKYVSVYKEVDKGN